MATNGNEPKKPAGLVRKPLKKAASTNQKPSVKTAKATSSASSSTAASTPNSSKIQNTREFFLDDLSKTLFPLETNRFIIENGESDVKEYIRKCLDPGELSYGFNVQKRVYASKPGGYLRRTVKLDPVAEYYLYDVVFRNRVLFRKPHSKHRTHYGYRFEAGAPIAATHAYKAFKGGLSEYSDSYEHIRGMDVATYFNSLYHHDIVNWFHELGAPEEDAEGLGKLLREISSGRSIDCLPQGLYPSKMIGNDFLRFIDNYHGIKSDQLIRFMDDIYIFSNDEKAVDGDFQTIQQLLGNRGLSLNSQKTKLNDSEQANIDNEIDSVKKKLLARRRYLITIGYDDAGDEVVKQELIKHPLSSEEMKYIDAILEKPLIEEDDAELILTIMRGHANKIERRLPYIIATYPHLAKNVYAACSDIDDKEAVAEMLIGHLKENVSISENQMFWFSATIGDQLLGTSKASSLISIVLGHASSTNITMAKLLEVPDKRFGLSDVREVYLKNGQSDWLGWASAVGSRTLKPAARNHLLKYWANSSNTNHLITSVLMKF